MPSLFDDVRREDHRPAYYREPKYVYLNFSARPEMARGRDILESWFTRYPTQAQPDLLARFRSNRKVQHYGAMLELFLHELLTRLDCSVEVHPPGGNTRKPDFLVSPIGSPPFYLEATLATGESTQEAAGEARLADVYDALDRLDSPNFFIGIELLGGVPLEAFPARQLRAFIERNLASVDPDEIAAQLNAGQAGPRWEFPGSGIVIFPIPKSLDARGQANIRPMGIQVYPPSYVTPHIAVRDALREKASRYGQLQHPYTIAVHAVSPVFSLQDDALRALFGSPEVTVDYDKTTGRVLRSRPGFKRDGLWTSSPDGATNRQVTAVLFVHNVWAWSLPRTVAHLYGNPWSSPCPPSLLRLTHVKIEGDGQPTLYEGNTPASILGLIP